MYSRTNMSPCYQNLRVKSREAVGQRGEGKEVKELDTPKVKKKKKES